MDYLKRFLFNILLLGIFMGIVYLAFPGIMGLVFQAMNGLMGPFFLLLVVIWAALPSQRKRKYIQRLNQNKDNQSGLSTEKMANKRYYLMVAYGLIGFCIITLFAVMMNNAKTLGIGGMGLIILFLLFKFLPDLLFSRLDKKQKEIKRALKGAESEVLIENLLYSLPDRYYVINDITSKFGNIDHVVIKQDAGVFLIETKSHHGTVSFQEASILLNGQVPEKDFVRQTLYNAYWLRDEINKVMGKNVWIFPVIVFTNAFVPFSKPIKGVHIVNKKFLQKTLEQITNINSLNQEIWKNREKIYNQLKGCS